MTAYRLEPGRVIRTPAGHAFRIAALDTEPGTPADADDFARLTVHALNERHRAVMDEAERIAVMAQAPSDIIAAVPFRPETP